MKPTAPTFLLFVTMILSLGVLAAPAASQGDAPPQQHASDAQVLAAWQKLLGSGVAPSRIVALQSMISPADGGDLAARFTERPSGDAPGFLAENLSLKVQLQDASFTIESARILLEPAADGRSVRFDVTGSAFGTSSKLHAEGTITWSAGPLGGDKLAGRIAIENADVAVLRTAFPSRFDPSFVGVMTMHADLDGVVAETSDEEAPATPLKGKLTASIDWSLLGRTSPLQITADFSIDDRMARVPTGRMTWQGLSLDLKGTVGPKLSDDFRLVGSFANVDAAKVTTDWNVPEPWRPQALLTGKLEFWGKPGNSFIGYVMEAPSVVVPAMAGFPVRSDKTRFEGRLAAINGEVGGSVQPTGLTVGPFELGDVSFGIRWFREQLQVNIANTKLWGAEAAVSASYKPAEHPAALFSGEIGPIAMKELAPRVVPHLALDLEGIGEASFRSGRDASRQAYFSGRAGIRKGRWGQQNLFASLLRALAEADPALASPAADALVPQHRSGKGTPGDRLLLEFQRNDGGYEVAGVVVRIDEIQLAADGTMTETGALALRGYVHLPAPFADALQASAAWIAPLRVDPAGGLYILVLIQGTAAAPTIVLAPAFRELLTQAKAGQPVQPSRGVAIKTVLDDLLPDLAIDIE